MTTLKQLKERRDFLKDCLERTQGEVEDIELEIRQEERNLKEARKIKCHQ